MTSAYKNQILNRIWRPVEGRAPLCIYALVDAAISETIYPKIMSAGVNSVCLHRGKNAEELAWVASYLVSLEKDDPFVHWLLDTGWGKVRFIFVRSLVGLNQFKPHFLTFLTVYDSEGKSYFFRFYDPKVFRTYLPACNEMELRSVFAPVESYIVEEKDPDVLLHFSTVEEKLKKETLALA